MLYPDLKFFTQGFQTSIHPVLRCLISYVFCMRKFDTLNHSETLNLILPTVYSATFNHPTINSATVDEYTAPLLHLCNSKLTYTSASSTKPRWDGHTNDPYGWWHNTRAGQKKTYELKRPSASQQVWMWPCMNKPNFQQTRRWIERLFLKKDCDQVGVQCVGDLELQDGSINRFFDM